MACILLHSVTSNAIGEETINKNEILKIFEQLKEQEKKTADELDDTIAIPQLSPEEARQISRKESMLKMIDREISLGTPSTINIPLSDYSLLNVNNTQVVLIPEERLNNYILQNFQTHGARKLLFSKKSRVENTPADSDAFRMLENELLRQEVAMSDYQQGIQQQMQIGGANMSTAISDLVELKDGSIYKNHTVRISEDMILLTHIEEINYAKQ